MSGTSPTLTDAWGPPIGGPSDTYNVYEGPAQGAETLLASVPGAQTTFPHTGAALGSRWVYVTAVTGGAESAHSNEVNVLVLPPVAFGAFGLSDIRVLVPALPPGIPAFDLQRAVNLSGAPGSWSTLQPGVAPSSLFDDPNLPGGGSYFYRLAATSVAGTAFYGPAMPARTTTMTEEQHFFSTGTLSATYLDHNLGTLVTAPFARVQGIDFNMDWAAKLLDDAAQIAVFPVDCAFSDGKFLVKAQHVGITADQVSFLAGLQLNVAGNPVIETINAVSFPEHCSLTFIGQDTFGRIITITLTNVVSKGVSIPFKIADWAMADVEFHAIEDAFGNIGTIAVQR